MKLASISITMLFFCIDLLAQDTIPLRALNRANSKPLHLKTIDFLTDRDNIWEDTVRYNHRYSYVLKNINRFVYKEATAEQKGENLNTERPEILKGIKVPGFLSVKNISAPSLNQSAMKDSVDEQSRMQKYKDSLDKEAKRLKKDIDNCICINIVDYIKSNEGLSKNLHAFKEGGDKFVAQAKIFTTFATINGELEKLKLKTNLSWDEINGIKQDLIFTNIKISVEEKDEEQLIFKKYQTILSNSKSIVENELKNNVDILTSAAEKVAKNFEDCIDKLEKKLCGRKDTCNEGYISLVSDINRLKKCIQKILLFSNGIRNDLNEADSSIKEMETVFKEGKIDALQINYNLLVHENFELELEPFIADKDIYEITFTAKAEGPLVFGKPANRIIKINAVTYRGWKVDYSTGAFFNWGNNKFIGPDYYFENPSDSTKIIREAGRTKKGLLSIGALMHLSYRTQYFIRPALSFGVSTTSGFDALNFHTGISMIFGRPGKVNRVILTYGFTWREVDLLNSRYVPDEERKDYPDAVPVSKNFPIRGSFIALTYNLSGINK